MHTMYVTAKRKEACTLLSRVVTHPAAKSLVQVASQLAGLAAAKAETNTPLTCKLSGDYADYEFL